MPGDKKPVTIRRSQQADADELADLAVRTFADTYADMSEAEVSAYAQVAFDPGRLREEISDPSIHVLVAVCDHALCGFAKLEPATAPPAISGEHPIELVRLYVDPQWVGRGVGSAMLAAAFEVAAAGGFDTCWLRVWVENQRAIVFYQRWGFAEVGSELIQVGDSLDPVLLMQYGL